MIAIIGAGLAGLACATVLGRAGLTTRLFDKGRGPGGRMATRRIDTPLGPVTFDHGAQFFTAREPSFQAQVEAWALAGMAARWPAAGDEAWVGTPTMNAPLKGLAKSLDVAWSTRVDRIERDGAGWRLFGDGLPETRFETVVVALPAEQAGVLLSPWDAAFASHPASTPCWTLMAAFPERLDIPTDCFRDRAPIGWAARNSAKPGRAGPEAWVIQADPRWSSLRLEEAPEAVATSLLAAFAAVAGISPPSPLVASAHRWRFAKSGATGREADWNATLRLGVCGDWLIGPRVEAAYLSGEKLARRIITPDAAPTA